MNVGQKNLDWVQRKTVAHSAFKEGLNFQAQATVVRWLWWSFGARGLQRGEWICAPYSSSRSAKGAKTCHICLDKKEKNPGGQCCYMTRSQPKELSYRDNPLPISLSPNRISFTFLSPDSCFPNSILKWGWHRLPRRYFSSVSLILLLESFPQNLISICFIVN